MTKTETLSFRSASLSDIGKKRLQNQDSVLSDSHHGIFVVADGMGGHSGGEVASKLAVDVVIKAISHRLSQEHSSKNFQARASLLEAIEGANFAIYEESRRNPNLSGMGTTVVSAFVRDNKLYVGHVGDSRLYLFKDGQIWQITRDHSLVQEKLRAGMISREQAKADKMKNVITRSVGYESTVLVDIYEMDLFSGDFLLLCSDGLSGPLSDLELIQNIQELYLNIAPNLRSDELLKELLKNLIKLANNKGGDDNISALAIEIL